jgi:hypothetical protein
MMIDAASPPTAGKRREIGSAPVFPMDYPALFMIFFHEGNRNNLDY